MQKEKNKIDRRNFLKTMGAAGIGPVLASAGSAIAGPNTPDAADTSAPKTAQKPKFPQVPKRKLGKTGVEVSCLSLGMMYNVIDNQIILNKSLDLGVNYWDTANNYAGGNSELGIGKYLSRNPHRRKDIFLITKASIFGRPKTVAEVERLLQLSLKRMNTDYIDLYFGVHAMSDPADLTDELRDWARSAKKRKLIRFFGFTTHSNMVDCLNAAARLDWIDAIMTSYNFRLMQDSKMLAAVDACHKAGIGLVAMKTTGQTTLTWARQELETEADKKLIKHLLQRGFTQEQATIKLVLEDQRIISACVGMQNVGILTANVDAVLSKTKLSQADAEAFSEYARATCSGYCAGCASICNAVLPNAPYVSDIMRYLMYHNSYGQQDRAKKLFAQIPDNVRSRLLDIDYTGAEARCPQHLPIAKLVAEAASKLT